MRKLLTLLTATALVSSCGGVSGLSKVKEPKITPKPTYSFGEVTLPKDPLESLKKIKVHADFKGVPVSVAVKAICKAKKLACNLTGFNSQFPITIENFNGSLYDLLKVIERTTRFKFSYEDGVLTVVNADSNEYAKEVERKLAREKLKVEGPKITLNLQGVPLFTVFNEINAATGYTVVPDRDVDLTQKVFVAVKDLPLDKALKVILSPLGYSFTIDPENKEIKVSALVTRVFRIPYIPKQVSFNFSAGESSTVEGSTSGTTTTSSSSGSSGTNEKSVTIQTDFWSELEKNIKNVVSKRGSYFVNKTARIVTVTDTPENIAKVEKVINSLIKAVSQQVQFRVAIYEVTYSDEFQSGVDWSAVFGSQNLQITTGQSTGYVFDLSGYFKAGKSNPFNYLVKLLSRYGKVKTIYDNYVRTLSGETVAIVPGETYRFLESIETQSQADTKLVTQVPVFKELSLGIQLYITPLKRDDGTTQYELDVTNRFIKSLKTYTFDNNTYTVPELIGRTDISLTTVIPKHHFEVITGIKQYKLDSSQSGVPGLMDIPVAGELFKGRSRKATLSEYIVAIYSY
ncbi:hypothetical protein Theam_1790 (plasmid) [Thermovibrio ammonificans HB-1]|uniref:Uncharacterized protein n=1 Tax=Thermovibrio ammonificans (strain DSM 15698 / JCM 12110 / HB-1) TaxID=648996 RepID=E8T6S3_THEA1|nr:secretin N-terminal domain-containing protein [Thermovibrio ammonificans]ADU97746.1 hypothetical protein Theam_1790 [Thermovibrio ammonificans HB-1]